MFRRSFRILSWVSALFAFLVMAEWVRSWFVGDSFAVGRWDVPSQTYEALRVEFRADYVRFAASRTVPPPADMPLVRIRVAMSPGPHFEHETTGRGRIGFDDWAWWNHYVDQPSQGGSQDVRLIQVRPWLIVLAFAILPALRLTLSARRRRARRHAERHGLCQQCGYDLRGSPGRCPECGKEPPARTTTTAAPTSPPTPVSERSEDPDLLEPANTERDEIRT